jgi:hypothetical protein
MIEIRVKEKIATVKDRHNTFNFSLNLGICCGHEVTVDEIGLGKLRDRTVNNFILLINIKLSL